MAQARVTDYFAQSKNGGVTRSLRSKGQKVSGDAVESAVIAKPKTPSRSKSTCSSRKTTRDPSTPDPQKHVQQEFLKVIDEALSAQTDNVTATDLRDVSNEGLTASPRTPKRTAEFDVCSVLFPSTTELHSSAKKRMRVNARQTCRASPEERTLHKTARKKLDLLRHEHEEQVTLPIARW